MIELTIVLRFTFQTKTLRQTNLIPVFYHHLIDFWKMKEYAIEFSFFRFEILLRFS